MKSNTSEIFVLLDESGSMAGLGNTTREAVSQFIKEQKAAPGEAYITIASFSDESKLVKQGNLKDIETQVTKQEYCPEEGGSTALADAVVRYINQLGSKFASMPEDQRPENVIFVIVTDGGENSSQTYTIANAKDKIKHQTDKYNWKFIYLASGLEAVTQGYTLGLSMNNIGSYTSSAQGIQAAVYVASSGTLRGRQGLSTDITSEEHTLLASSN